MKDSPWAKCGMFITPKISASPTDINAHMPPVTRVVNSCDGPPLTPISTAMTNDSRPTTKAGVFLRDDGLIFCRTRGSWIVLVLMALLIKSRDRPCARARSV